jgi:hypothetical protein
MSNFAVFSLGIMPYITSSIPGLSSWQRKASPAARKYSRYPGT